MFAKIVASQFAVAVVDVSIVVHRRSDIYNVRELVYTAEIISLSRSGVFRSSVKRGQGAVGVDGVGCGERALPQKLFSYPQKR